MSLLSRASVKTKLILASVLSSGCALLLVGAVIAAYDFFALRATLARRLSVQAEIVGANALSALLFSDPHSAETTLAALKADPHILCAGLYAADGHLFATYASEPASAAGLLAARIQDTGEGRVIRDGRLLLSRTLRFDGKPIGTVVLASDLREITSTMARDVAIFTSILMISLLLALAISSRLQRDISQPILSLAGTARRVSQEKDYSVRAAGGGGDEIGTLVSAFNTMLEEIQQQERALRTAHDGLEQRVTERTAQLEAANHELEAFSYSVSHDLRAPLRHISGFAEILSSETEGLNDAGRNCVKKITQASARMGQLIDDLLLFSRMGRTDLQSSDIDLRALLDDVLKEQQADAKRAIDWQVGPLPFVRADPSMLRLVLVNLVSNAVKYSGKTARPRIEIDVASETVREIVIRVRDNGVGFDKAYASKLFGVFQRLHRAEEFEGTGIGLANVRRIIERHGGRTWADAAPGQGASFYFSLPKYTEAVA